MIICEALLLTCLSAVLFLSSYTDCKNNIILNKHLFRCAISAIIVDIIYYMTWATSFLTLFAINMVLLIAVGIVFYVYNLWAAGDCKLLIVVGLCIPGRFYSFWGTGIGISFYIVAGVFSLAFIYIVLESIVLGIKDKQLFKVTFEGFDWKESIVSYLAMVGSLALIGKFLSSFFPGLANGGTAISVAINFLIVLTMIQVRQRMDFKVLLGVLIVVWSGIAILSISNLYEIRFGGNTTSWFLVLLVMALRMISDKYNYKVIPTSEVRQGQILSASTILGFSASRVRGLPSGATEDLRSRLTEAEAESVRRWETSAHGKPYVVIVRKIPFAVFISTGTIIFLVFEVAMQ